MTAVDVVVVSYNSAGELRGTVEPLTRLDGVSVYVVDNASRDGSVASISDLSLTIVESAENLGFSGGNNLGWRRGSSPYVLFLNPDAHIEADALRGLVEILDARPEVGIAAPKIVGENGELNFSLRRFPRLRSTYAQAFFLHRLAPRATWADEIIRTEEHYERPGPQEWVSGACVLVRRDALERLGGWDDGFFLYCEDIDLCRRVQGLGLDVHYEPAAVVRHVGGASSPAGATLPILAASRVRYALLHRAPAYALVERAGVALEAFSRALAARGGRQVRAGHVRSLLVAVRGRTQARPLGDGVNTLEGV